MEYSPDPCNSFLLDEALERGVDLTKLHKEHDTWPIHGPFWEGSTWRTPCRPFRS